MTVVGFAGIPSRFPGIQLCHILSLSDCTGWAVLGGEGFGFALFGLGSLAVSVFSGRSSSFVAALTTFPPASFSGGDIDSELLLLGDVAASGVALTMVVVALMGNERFDVPLPRVMAKEGGL